MMWIINGIDINKVIQSNEIHRNEARKESSEYLIVFELPYVLLGFHLAIPLVIAYDRIDCLQ